MQTKLIFPRLTFFLFVVVTHNAWSSPQDPESLLRSTFQDKVFVLRGFPSEKSLNFDAQCNLEGNHKVESWTVSHMLVKSARIQHDRVQLSGERLALGVKDREEKLVLVKTGKKVEINIAVDPSQFNADTIDRLRNRVFVKDSNELVNLVPDYWAPYLTGRIAIKIENGKPVYFVGSPVALAGAIATDSSNTGASAGTDLQLLEVLPSGEQVYKVKDLVKAPHPVYTPDPVYSKIARELSVQGTTIFQVVVDKNGSLTRLQLVKPIGMGLDEKAAETISKWRFKPALRDGEPVSVRIRIEVNFNLY